MTIHRQTAMAAALSKAGFDTAEMLVRQCAVEAMRKHHDNVPRAEPTFAKLIAEHQLTDADVRRALLRSFATVISGEGQQKFDPQIEDTQAGKPNGGGADPDACENRSTSVSPPPPPRGGNGQSDFGDHQLRAIPVREPSAIQRLANINAAKTLAITVFDTFRTADGRGIGDIRIGEVERLRATDAQRASVYRQIQRLVPDAPHEAMVRDVVKVEELQRMIQRGAEVADAS